MLLYIRVNAVRVTRRWSFSASIVVVRKLSCHGRQMGVPDFDATDACALNQRVRYLQQVRDHLRERFRSECLDQLYRAGSDSKKMYTVNVGDIVLIGNDQQKRLDWILGKVIQLFPGKDGVTRVVRVKTMNGELTRPVQRLYPLELNSETEGITWEKLQSEVQSSRVSETETDGFVDTSVCDQNEQTPPDNIQSSTAVKANQRKIVVNDRASVTMKTRSGRDVRIPSRYRE